MHLRWSFYYRSASSPSPSLLCNATSPKGRGLGKTRSFAAMPKAPSPRELSSVCETEGVYRSTTLPTSAGEAGTMPRTALSVLRWTVKVTLRPAAKSGW